MKARPFELALWIGFGILGVLGLIILATYNPPSNTEPPPPNAIAGSVSIWGTLPADAITVALSQVGGLVSYQQVSADTFGEALLRALADGTPPDLVLIPHELLVAYRDRFQPFSYEQLPVRTFRDRYLDGASIFAQPEGIYGVPLLVDPLIMYWNRNVLTSAGFLEAPRTWQQLLDRYFPSLIQRGSDRSITEAVVAMGTVRNITNAVPIINTLLLQGGSDGVSIQDGEYVIGLDRQTGGEGRPFLTAVDFYTRFSTYNNIYYTWNQSLPTDRDMFLQENLALYFGFGSEARDLQRRNPNLNFDIAEMPQGAEATLRRTYGRQYSLALLRRAPNPTAALTVLAVLSNDQVMTQLASQYGMAPASRSLVAAGSSDLYGRTIYQSAPIAFGWLSPEPSALQSAMGTMVEDIINERRTLSEAVADGLTRIQLSY
jgi:ABC-type glycerol-3-phosphate transport system substrate-binding protein